MDASRFGIPGLVASSATRTGQPVNTCMADTSVEVRLNRYRDAQLVAFEAHLERVIRQAQQATLDLLMRKLTIKDGIVERTPANLKLIRRLNQVFMSELDKAGYNSLVNAFVGEFPGHLPLMQEVADQIAEATNTPLPKMDFTPADLNLFKSVAVSSAQQIRTVIETEATKALGKVMFSFGGMKFKDMVALVMDQGLGATVARARVVADTAQSGFYRLMLDRQFEKLEAANPNSTPLYRYTGPNDSRCRPFCHKMMNSEKKTWTRTEIDQLDNGTPLPVWTFCGAWLCRHSWDLAGWASNVIGGIPGKPGS